MRVPEYEAYHEKKSHFDTDFPYNTYLCSIPLDFMQVPLHWHEEAEFIYVKKGRGKISIDFTSYEVASGNILIILPGQMHSIEQLSDFQMEYENIIFHPSMFTSSGTDLCYQNYLLPILEHQLNISQLFTDTHPLYASMRSCLDQNDMICMSFPSGYPLAIKGNLFNFFFLLYTNYKDQLRDLSKSKNIEKLKTVIKHVEMNYDSTLTIEEMAALCNFSESHFMKFFKQTMGQSFIDYLNEYRLTMAARLLLQSDDTILSIASACGYDNLSYFNRSFKKRYGTTPSAYRK